MSSNKHPKRQRTLTRERLAFIRRHLDKSDTEMARMLGIHRSAVHQLRQRYKITKVHSFTLNKRHMTEKLRKLKPGFSIMGAARHLGISTGMALKYGRLAGYRFLTTPVVKHFYWRNRIKKLPPLLSVTAVARELGLSYNHAALLCKRHKYKATLRTGRNRQRVPIRNYQLRPKHERWLASLKPVKS